MLRSKYLIYISLIISIDCLIERVATKTVPEINDNLQIKDVSSDTNTESKRLLACKRLECNDSTDCTITDFNNLSNTIKTVRNGRTTDLQTHIAVKAQSSVMVELQVPSLDYNLADTIEPSAGDNFIAYRLLGYVELYFKKSDINNRSYMGLMAVGKENETEPPRVHYKETVRDFLEKSIQLKFNSSKPFTLLYDCPKPVQV